MSWLHSYFSSHEEADTFALSLYQRKIIIGYSHKTPLSFNHLLYIFGNKYVLYCKKEKGIVITPRDLQSRINQQNNNNQQNSQSKSLQKNRNRFSTGSGPILFERNPKKTQNNENICWDTYRMVLLLANMCHPVNGIKKSSENLRNNDHDFNKYFTGNEFIKWIQNSQSMDTNEAIKIFQNFVQRGFIINDTRSFPIHFSVSELYRLVIELSDEELINTNSQNHKISLFNNMNYKSTENSPKKMISTSPISPSSSNSLPSRRKTLRWSSDCNAYFSTKSVNSTTNFDHMSNLPSLDENSLNSFYSPPVASFSDDKNHKKDENNHDNENNNNKISSYDISITSSPLNTSNDNNNNTDYDVDDLSSYSDIKSNSNILIRNNDILRNKKERKKRKKCVSVQLDSPNDFINPSSSSTSKKRRKNSRRSDSLSRIKSFFTKSETNKQRRESTTARTRTMLRGESEGNIKHRKSFDYSNSSKITSTEFSENEKTNNDDFPVPISSSSGDSINIIVLSNSILKSIWSAMKDSETGLPLKERKYKMKLRNCFSGKNAVDWIDATVAHLPSVSGVSSISICKQLFYRKFIRGFNCKRFVADKKHFYSLSKGAK